MSDVTRILLDIESGNPSAAEGLLPLVYTELRKLAAAKLAQEKPGQTLGPSEQQAGQSGRAGSCQLLVELDGHIPGQGNRIVNTARVINDSGHFAGETLGNVVSEPESSKKRAKEYYAYEFLDVPYLVNGKLRSTAWDLI